MERLLRQKKTAIVHFKRKPMQDKHGALYHQGTNSLAKGACKFLGLIMDAQLKYREHVARAASKGLEAAMMLRRLRGLSPSIALQLFTSTVVPTVDYASSVGMHVFKDRLLGPINRVQKTGAQAIIGTFSTMATWGRRGRGRGAHRHRGRALLVTSRQAVDRHPYLT